ncbi:MAG TPA: flagellar hook-length control protein FliK [Chthonomonadaceae bacterium]|nr:flagellar hook-length control protein FliK [Chthonomonadaceae bacterium]
MVTPSTSLPSPISGSGADNASNTGPQAATESAASVTPFAALISQAAAHDNGAPGKPAKPGQMGLPGAELAAPSTQAAPNSAGQTDAAVPAGSPLVPLGKDAAENNGEPAPQPTAPAMPPLPDAAALAAASFAMGLMAPVPAPMVAADAFRNAVAPETPLAGTSGAEAVPGAAMPASSPGTHPALQRLSAVPAATIPELTPPLSDPLIPSGVPMDSHAGGSASASGVGIAPIPFTAAGIAAVPATQSASSSAPNATSTAAQPAMASPSAPAVAGMSRKAAQATDTSAEAVSVQRPTPPVATGATDPAASGAVPPGSMPATAPAFGSTPGSAAPARTPQGGAPIVGDAADPAPVRPLAAQRLDSVERLLAVGDLDAARSESAPTGTPRAATESIAPEAPAAAPSTLTTIPATAPAEAPTTARSFQATPAVAPHPDQTATLLAPPSTLPGAETSRTAVVPTALAQAAAQSVAPPDAAGVPKHSEATARIPVGFSAEPAHSAHTASIAASAENSANPGRQEDAPGHSESGTRREPDPTIPASATGAAQEARHLSSRAASASASAGLPGLTAERAFIVEQVTRHLETMRMTGGRGEIALRLQPETLGSLHLTISAHADGVVAHIVTETAQAQRALEEARDHLRAALESKGLRLSELEISVGHGAVSDGRAAFAGPQERAGRAFSGTRLRPVGAPETEADVSTPLSRAPGLRDRLSRLDYRA